jgi:membrane dipeptidase
MESQGQLRMLRNWHDVETLLENWTRADAGMSPLGFILSMEGADPVVSPSQIPEWWDRGLRVIGPVHYGTGTYAHGTGAAGGLSIKGRELLKAMQEVGMILDVTHLADQSFWQAVEIFEGAVLASHNNCRALVPGCRQFTDDQLRHLIGRGSVIGAALDAWMLCPGWTESQTPRSAVSLEAVVNHIDHICQLAGNASHAAIGSDLDGGFGTEQSPQDLDTIADLQKIPMLLRQRGYKEADVEAVMHANWLRFFRKTWSSETVD